MVRGSMTSGIEKSLMVQGSVASGIEKSLTRK